MRSFTFFALFVNMTCVSVLSHADCWSHSVKPPWHTIYHMSQNVFEGRGDQDVSNVLALMIQTRIWSSLRMTSSMCLIDIIDSRDSNLRILDMRRVRQPWCKNSLLLFVLLPPSNYPKLVVDVTRCFLKK